MSAPTSYKGVLKLFGEQPAELQKYFEYLPKLVSADLPYDVALAYLFSRIERAHRRTLYCGLTKRYAANTEFTDKIVRKEYLTRDEFKKVFQAVFAHEFPDRLTKLIEHAEEMRDTGMHGRETTAVGMRQAIHDVFEYAREFNTVVSGLAGFQPFGDLRGFKGRQEGIDVPTTRWILKGMGFRV